MKKLILLIVTLCLVGCTSNATTQGEGESTLNKEDLYESSTLVEVEQGLLEGMLVDDVLVYQGIPYAKAPVDDLRWKAPEDPDKWEGTFDATIEAEVATQVSANEIIGSEDCLNLNITRPNNNEDNLPVLLFIHGGNNQTGTSTEIDASILSVETNSIVVSINYRLGALGFINLPSLKTGDEYEDSGNFTLLDIAKSLDWINENISNFGGDENNITISGFSAGGRDVMAMLISPIFEDKFDKAISLSGGMTVTDPQLAMQTNAEAFATLVIEDQIKETQEEAIAWLLEDNEEVKEYLYSLSDERIATLMANASIRMEVFPHLITDGVILPTEGFNTEDYNDVPLLMLTSSSEFSLFGTFDTYFNNNEDGSLNEELAFALNYGNQLYELFNAEESANKMYDYYDSAIYLADIEYGTNTNVVSKELNSFGAFHGVFIPFLTGKTTGFSSMFQNDFTSDNVNELTDVFMQYIKNFIWNGDPNGEDLVVWENYSTDPNSNNQMVFDIDENGIIVEMVNERINYSEVIKAIEEDQSITEEEKLSVLNNVLNGRWFSQQLDEYFN